MAIWRTASSWRRTPASRSTPPPPKPEPARRPTPRHPQPGVRHAHRHPGRAGGDGPSVWWSSTSSAATTSPHLPRVVLRPRRQRGGGASKRLCPAPRPRPSSIPVSELHVDPAACRPPRHPEPRPRRRRLGPPRCRRPLPRHPRPPAAAALGGSYARLRPLAGSSVGWPQAYLRAVCVRRRPTRPSTSARSRSMPPDTTSDLVYKGAMAGRSRSVYTALIRVDEGARTTDARRHQRPATWCSTRRRGGRSQRTGTGRAGRDGSPIRGTCRGEP